MNKANISIIGKKCTGCKACECTCPTNAISFQENFEGFFYPIVDDDKCISCRKCYQVCQSNGINNVKSEPLKAIGLKNKNRDELLKSASGGAAFIIAKHIIVNGGIVFGAVYDDELVVRHRKISKLEDLPKIQSSKYVQSDIGGTFIEAKKLLESGGTVLFTGTPCQIAGLKLFLNREYENLYTIDIICHGVPSPKLFKYNLESISRNQKSKVIKWDFRYKLKKGWGTNYYFQCKNGETDTNPIEFTRYGNDFLKGLNYRESCYICAFSNPYSRPADITIGDFWRLMKVNPKFYSNDGVSSVIVNSEKGMKLLSLIKKNIEFFECDYKQIVFGQDNLKGPTVRPKERDTYYNNMSSSYFDNKYKVPIKERVLNFLPQWVIVTLKKLNSFLR